MVSPASAMKRAQALVAWCVLASTAWALGCGDWCPDGSGKCEGNTAWLCSVKGHDSGGPTAWHEYEDCGQRVCKASHLGAVCSLSDAKDQVCAFSTNIWPGAGVCVGSGTVYCALGYRIEEGPDCQSPALCQPDGLPISCFELGGRHPICDPLQEPNLFVRTRCYNNQVLFCREGRLLSYTDCSAGQCTTGTAPPAGAEYCKPDGKCIPYAAEPSAVCQP
jgi:hypothetical protein